MRRDLPPREEGGDWVVGEHVADDPAVALRADDLGGAQVAEGLRDGRIEQAGRRGQVRDADWPGSTMQVSRVSRVGSASTA